MKSNIFSTFKSLTYKESDNNSFYVSPLENMHHKIGISREGFPIFFIKTDLYTDVYSQNLHREILSVEYNVSCTINEMGTATQDACFSIITLRTTEQDLQSYFFDIFFLMLKKLNPIPTNKELSLEVENLISIFSAMSRKPLKKIQGLWAELLVIERSKRPEILIQAWHNSPGAKYDFTLGKDKIEVKSTSSENRTHRFSLDQLNPSLNSRLVIASCKVRESAQNENNGFSLTNLFDRICQRISSIDLRIKLYSIIAETLGINFKEKDNIYFDYTEASDSLAFFDAKDVPHINKDLIPKLVSEVKFQSDLSHLIDIFDSSSKFDKNNSELFNSLI